LSERVTEDLTLQEMQLNLGENENCYVYEQGDIPRISKINSLLKKAGGKPKFCDLDDYNKGGNGKSLPEFLITFPNDRNTIIVIECKKTVNKHCSEKMNQPKDYAVDGVLYYAKFLKEEYNVIAIAVSGTNKDKWKITTYDWRKCQNRPQELKKARDILYSPVNYLRLINGEDAKKALSMDEIQKIALTMHDHLRNLKISEKMQPVFIAGILIALKDKDFSLEYNSATSFDSLHNRLKFAINNVLNESDVRPEKINDIKHHFEMIGKNGKIKSVPLEENQSLLWFISELDKKIKPMMDFSDDTVDALGVFYHEFVKYSGGDGNGLGIVLTPQHLTEFMCELAQVNKNSKVLDICCGSGAFLVTAMSKMFVDATEEDIDRIKRNSLFGVEFDDDIYTLSIANMIVRGDGKSNIIYGDCFDKKIIQELKNKNINIGLINPPYSQKDHSELEFVNNLLDILTVGGIGVAVVPMSCAIGTKFKTERELLFKKHTLKAVFSMPDEIFSTNKASTNVCVMLWEAHKPHNSSQKTYFGYYKDDGFVKAKKLGRIDKFNRWNSIKQNWLENYNNKEIKPGISCMKSVKWYEEWSCELYLETDFSALTQADFAKKVKLNCVYLLQNGLKDDIKSQAFSNENFQLNFEDWQWFNFVNIFKTRKRGKRLKSEDREPGDVFYFSASEANNGLTDKISNPLFKMSDALIYTTFGDGFYVECLFTASDEITILKDPNLNKYNGLFIATVISKDKYRYRFGRKAFYNKIQNVKIKLPAIKKDDGSYSPDWDYMEKYIKSLPYSSNL